MMFHDLQLLGSLFESEASFRQSEQIGGKYDACFQVTKTGGVGFELVHQARRKASAGPFCNMVTDFLLRKRCEEPREPRWGHELKTGPGNVGDGEQDHARDLRRQLQLPGGQSTGPADHD